jgi:hypothetical protein
VRRKVVLDLACGHGLVGILFAALERSVEKVLFLIFFIYFLIFCIFVFILIAALESSVKKVLLNPKPLNPKPQTLNTKP